MENIPIDTRIERKYPDISFQKMTLSNVRKVNKEFRTQDDSSSWPINGRYNVTDRAITRLYNTYRKYIEFQYVLEYILALDSMISDLVNSY